MHIFEFINQYLSCVKVPLIQHMCAKYVGIKSYFPIQNVQPILCTVI